MITQITREAPWTNWTYMCNGDPTNTRCNHDPGISQENLWDCGRICHELTLLVGIGTTWIATRHKMALLPSDQPAPSHDVDRTWPIPSLISSNPRVFFKNTSLLKFVGRHDISILNVRVQLHCTLDLICFNSHPDFQWRCQVDWYSECLWCFASRFLVVEFIRRWRPSEMM